MQQIKTNIVCCCYCQRGNWIVCTRHELWFYSMECRTGLVVGDGDCMNLFNCNCISSNKIKKSWFNYRDNYLMYKYTLFGIKCNVFKRSCVCSQLQLLVYLLQFLCVQHHVSGCCSVYRDTQNLRTDTMCCDTCDMLCVDAASKLRILEIRFWYRLGVSDDATFFCVALPKLVYP